MKFWWWIWAVFPVRWSELLVPRGMIEQSPKAALATKVPLRVQPLVFDWVFLFRCLPLAIVIVVDAVTKQRLLTARWLFGTGVARGRGWGGESLWSNLNKKTPTGMGRIGRTTRNPRQTDPSRASCSPRYTGSTCVVCVGVCPCVCVCACVRVLACVINLILPLALFGDSLLLKRSGCCYLRSAVFLFLKLQGLIRMRPRVFAKDDL